MNKSDWQAHVSAFEASGQSARAYCSEHDLVYHRFKYWQHKFRDQARSVDGFAPVRVVRESAPGQALAVVEFPSGVRLAVYDTSLLTNIAAWLQR